MLHIRCSKRLVSLLCLLPTDGSPLKGYCLSCRHPFPCSAAVACWVVGAYCPAELLSATLQLLKVLAS